MNLRGTYYSFLTFVKILISRFFVTGVISVSSANYSSKSTIIENKKEDPRHASAEFKIRNASSLAEPPTMRLRGPSSLPKGVGLNSSGSESETLRQKRKARTPTRLYHRMATKERDPPRLLKVSYYRWRDARGQPSEEKVRKYTICILRQNSETTDKGSM